MNISEDNLRFVSELFNGDVEDVYLYKSGPKIFKFFNNYFGYNDSYHFGNSYPSRWNITYNKLVDIWNKSQFDKFLSIVLSLSYLKKEYPDKSIDELSLLSNKAISVINARLEDDGNKIIKFADSYKMLPINNDEILLGEGGYACCYYIKSKNIVEKRLKEENYIDAGVVSRFKREFEITKSLFGSYGIIKVYDFDEKKLSYTMELGECDLYKFINNKILDDDYKRKIIYQIIYIMNEVHKKDIIHRDLSPNNIFIISGELKIADFGLGKDLNAFYSHQTMKTNSVGQYYYCDPRQFMKLKDGDKQSDIYSIGKIINFVMTGNPNVKSHKYYSVVEKATCDEKFRYKSIQELNDGVIKIDKIEADKEFEKNFTNKLGYAYNNDKSVRIFDENDVAYICSFDGKKMFKMNKIASFRNAFVEAGEQELLDENIFLEKLNVLFEYCKNNNLEWEDYDDLGYLGNRILLSKNSYLIKEMAVNFVNLAISANRFNFIDSVRKDIIDNIDPTLEDKILKI